VVKALFRDAAANTVTDPDSAAAEPAAEALGGPPPAVGEAEGADAVGAEGPQPADSTVTAARASAVRMDE